MQNIRVEEAEYRAEQQAKEQALQDYRHGEKNAVEIAEEYRVRAQEQALQSHRLGERYAVEIAEDYEARKQAWLNVVDAARWAGVASVAQAKQESDASLQACFLPTEEAAPKADTISEGVSYLVDAVPGLRKMMAGIMLDGRPFKGGPEVKPLVNSKAMRGWAEWIYTRLGGKSGGVLNELELNQGVVGKSISSLDDAGSIVAKNAVKVTKGTWITAGVASLGINLYDYTIGEHKNEGLGQEFAVSTGVDILAAVGIGLAAAAIVSLAVASAPFTMSAAAVVGTTALVSIGISALFSAPLPIPGHAEPISASDAIKGGLNIGIDKVQSWWQKNSGG